MDTALPPVHRIDMRLNPDKYKQVSQPEEIKQNANFALPISPKCKFKLPCGRCEVTKEMCDYD